MNDDDVIMHRIDSMVCMEMPCKDFVSSRSKKFGFKISRFIRKAFDATCHFEPRGSAFDKAVHHISDVDILVVIESGVSPADATEYILNKFELHPFAVLLRDVGGAEVEMQTNTLPRDAFDESIETISVSMPLRMGKHTFPFDLTMTNRANEREETMEHRIQKLDANIKSGKYDKALQRIRPILKRLGASRDVRSVILDAMNERTGAVRFVHKQLQLSVDCKQVTPAVAAVGIAVDDLESALGIAKSRNINMAKDVLVEFLGEIMAVADGGEFEDPMRAALAPLVRSVVTTEDVSVGDEFIERLRTAWHTARHIQSIRKQIDDNAGNGLVEDVLSLHLSNAEEQAERHHRAVQLDSIGSFVLA